MDVEPHTQDFDRVVIHYAEIGLKARNREYFERLLMRNIKAKLPGEALRIRREFGQLTMDLEETADRGRILDVLKRVPGVAYASPAVTAPTDIPALEQAVVARLAGRQLGTFKIDTHRRDKDLPFKSMDVDRAVGAAVLAAHPEAGVRMREPELTVKVELTARCAYISTVRIPGVGGLPTNTRQRVVALMSGGLDSPVAAYLMMKRGCEVVLVHFQNANQLTASVENKITQLAAQLARYQVRTRLVIVPFEDLQNAIIRDIPAEQRMLIYRRVMLRLAGREATRRKAKFLAVGDSLSQVASQTYENLAATYAASPLPVLTPLIGLDKAEIVDIAREIETYDISAMPYGDCCSYFIPRHPELRARSRQLDELEAELDIAEAGDAALEEARVMEWGDGGR